MLKGKKRMEKLKVCPFCGSKPVLLKKTDLIHERNGRSMTPVLETLWTVRCNCCGTEKKAYGRTYYDITEDGELVVVPTNNENDPSDKRLEVIEMWNKRFE